MVLEECANYIIMDTVRQIVIEGTMCGSGEPVMAGIHSPGGGGGGGNFSAMDGRWSDQLKYRIDIKFDKELICWFGGLTGLPLN